MAPSKAKKITSTTRNRANTRSKRPSRDENLPRGDHSEAHTGDVVIQGAGGSQPLEEPNTDGGARDLEKELAAMQGQPVRIAAINKTTQSAVVP